MTFGVDYAWGRPGVSALKAAGVKFVCRYLSHDAGKDLSADEARALTKAGIWIVVVWESTAQRALSGHAAGALDAAAALGQAQACGMPADRPIYFAVDFDAPPIAQATINSYLDGAASVLGRDRVGLYGGYYVIKRAFDAGKITWGWQTYAWSGGHWDGRAQIQQYKNDQRINGVGVDYDRATRDDYGQWRVGVSPKEDDVTPQEIHDAVWGIDDLPAPGTNQADPFDPKGNPGFDPKRNPTWAPQSYLKQLAQGLVLVNDKVDRISTGGVDLDQLAAKLAPLIAPLVADEIAKRLED